MEVLKNMFNESSEKDVSIVICGEAGQGIQTVESILVQAIKMSGYHVFSSKEYMSRVRGGENSTEIRVSSNRVTAYVNRIDMLLALSKGTIKHLNQRISPETLIIGDENLPSTNYKISKIPLLESAKELGGPIFANVIAAGIISRILNIPIRIFSEIITKMFTPKGDKIVKMDIKAGEKGYEIGEAIIKSEEININLKINSEIKNELLLSGTEAVGIGCLAGGCKFMSSYPMTPSSPLQTFIAQHATDFDVIFEQAEDEITGINMSLGASYAGVRSIVATSGSGFALMGEAVGLSGMIETPVVIYVGQRPGPAVGLPTRSSQEDLNLTLYSGPGEFARIIFAPGNFEDAFKLSYMAFNLAEKYQIPVFILSDQYFAECYYNLPMLNLKDLNIEDYIVKTTETYKRYQFNDDNGVSPRGIPGFGEGLVAVDSDEHDEEGHITESMEVRSKMVDKRFTHKLKKLKEEAIEPDLLGGSNYKILIIGWGSTYGTIIEALNILNSDLFSFLHFKQVYPIHPNTGEYLKKAEKIIIFENNVSGQFANLIRSETGFNVDKKVLKYDGIPFSVEEVVESLENYMEEL